MILLGITLSFSVSGCGSTLNKYSMTATDLGFDTVVSFIGYTENEATFNEYSDIVRKEFRRYDQLFDKYNSYDGINNIKTINDNAGIKAVKVDKEIIELLEESKSYDQLTNHQFDITMGSVLNIWHDVREASLAAQKQNKETFVPSMDVLQSAAKHSGFDHVIINKKKQTVYINDKDVSLDVGGNAKGFAVEKIAQKLEKKGLKHAILNGGGNIRLIGSKPDNEEWKVGVQIPDFKAQNSDSLTSIKISNNMSIVTSGDYQRYYMYKDQIMHHIIDPSTLMPARHCRSVTVVTPDSGIADTLSTTLYTMSHEDGVQLLSRLKKEKGISADAIWVYDSKQPVEDSKVSFTSNGYDIIVSDGLKDKIVK